MITSAQWLIVDDEIDLLKPFQKTLELKGHKVDVALGGHEALRLFKETTYDIVLTDIQMPQGSGLELLTAIKKIEPKTPVWCFLSGSEVLSAREAYELGCDGILSKPFNINLIIEQVSFSLKPSTKRWAKKPYYANDTTTLDFTSQPLLGRGGFRVESERKDLVVGSFYNFKFNTPTESGWNGGGWLRWLDKPSQLLGIEVCYWEKGREEWVKHYEQSTEIAFIP